MKRPLVLSAIAFILGILIFEYVPHLAWGSLVTLATGISMFYLLRKSIRRSPFVLLYLPFLLAGFFLHNAHSERLNTLFQPWTDQNVLIRGAISDEPVRVDDSVSFVLQAHTIQDDKGKASLKGARIKVRLYCQEPPVNLVYGAGITLKTKIVMPSGLRNIGGFDYKRFLAARGISGTASVSLGQIQINGPSEVNPLKAWGYSLRRGILESLYGSMPEKEASLLAGMLIGYTADMPESLEESFRRAGLSHILAVSGANIAFLLFPLLWFLKRLGFNVKWASAISLPAMVFYVFATGMEASVIRAAIMAGVTLMGMILWRQTDIYCSMAFSSLLILLSNTFMLFDPGFILSFGATLSLVLFYKPIFTRLPVQIPKFLRDSFAGSFSAQLGVVPYLAASFNSFSAVSILSNLIIVPVTGLLTVLGAVLSLSWFLFRPISVFLGYAAALMTDFILWVTQVLSGLPWAELAVATPGFLLVLGYYLILGYIRFGYPRLPLKPSRRLLAVFLAVYGLMLLISALPSGKLEIYFTDVGQGDSILIRTPKGVNILIDGGGSPMDEEKSYTGEQILIPLLYDLKATRIDVMLASHGHADHINGLKSVLGRMKVNKLMIADAEDLEMNALLETASGKMTEVVRVREGDCLFEEGSLRLTAVYPFQDKRLMPDREVTSANEMSLVVKLEFGEFSALFTGDIGAVSEAKLLDRPELDADLLKVAHHGSRFSSCQAFLDAVSPVLAVISVGRNSFGHPSPEVEARLDGSRVYKTIRDGGILITVDPHHTDRVLVETVVHP